jgi:hypothetical protein
MMTTYPQYVVYHFVLEREMNLIISYNRFWWLTSNTNYVD